VSVVGLRFITTVPSTLTINPPKDEKRADLTAKERQEEIARERQKGGFKQGLNPLLFVSWRSSAPWRLKTPGRPGHHAHLARIGTDVRPGRKLKQRQVLG
jgi:hypothetical protein